MPASACCKAWFRLAVSSLAARPAVFCWLCSTTRAAAPDTSSGLFPLNTGWQFPIRAFPARIGNCHPVFRGNNPEDVSGAAARVVEQSQQKTAGRAARLDTASLNQALQQADAGIQRAQAEPARIVQRPTDQGLGRTAANTDGAHALSQRVQECQGCGPVPPI